MSSARLIRPDFVLHARDTRLVELDYGKYGVWVEPLSKLVGHVEPDVARAALANPREVRLLGRVFDHCAFDLPSNWWLDGGEFFCVPCLAGEHADEVIDWLSPEDLPPAPAHGSDTGHARLLGPCPDFYPDRGRWSGVTKSWHLWIHGMPAPMTLPAEHGDSVARVQRDQPAPVARVPMIDLGEARTVQRYLWVYRDTWWATDDLPHADALYARIDLALDGVKAAAAMRERAEEEHELIERAELIAEQRRRDSKLAWARATVNGEATPRARPGIPREVRLAVFERDGGACVDCGSTFELQFDHVIPYSMGGATTIENLQVLCGDCNRRKGATLG